MKRPLRFLTGCTLWLASTLLVVPAESGPVVDIVQPRSGEILYGETLISVVARSDQVATVLFYLDAFPSPICRAEAPPYECRFDAGTRFAGRLMRVDAYDAAGKLLGSDSLRSPDGTEPIRVTRYSIAVPVVVTTREGQAAEISPENLRCLYGPDDCEVLTVRKLAEEQALERQGPTFVEILVDTSSSRLTFRKELEAATLLLIDGTPHGTQVQLVEFAHVRRIVVPFTNDKETLRAGIADFGRAGDASCIFSAMRSSAEQLAAQEGSRALLVISDGVDTCDMSRLRYGRMHTYSGNEIVRAFQQLQVPLYLFRSAVPSFAKDAPTIITYENLAAATGGKLFSQGRLLSDYGGMSDGANMNIPWMAELVVSDLKRTYLVEVGLPEGTKAGTRKRLDLAHRDSQVELRHQEYWDSDSKKAELLRMLYANSPATREKAATHLAAIADAHMAHELLAALQVEPVLRVRAAELIAIYNSLIAGLLYGGEDDQKVAVKASELLAEEQPQAFAWLLPVTRVYLKTPAPAGLKKRVRALMGNDQP